MSLTSNEAHVTAPPTMHLAMRHLAALVSCFSAAACGAGWQAVPTPWPSSFAARQQVQIWSGHSTARLHGVVVTQDSLSGIPWLQPFACDSCRVAFPRATVDSLRTGDPSGGFWASIGWVLVGLVLASCEVGVQACPLAGGT
jgi:hypothetical protein